MPIAAVVILYFPNKEELVKNTGSYSRHVDHVFLMDNTPAGTGGHVPVLESLKGSYTYIPNDRNLGIAGALNKALLLADEKGFDWLLTMDQDSYFEEQQIVHYLAYFKKHFQHRHDVAIVCPESDPGAPITEINDAHQAVTRAITSGSLVQVAICKKLQGFDEKLFIDEVDFEYCYRCLTNGYKIFQFKNIRLTHRLGVRKKAGYFSIMKRSERVLHSPFRVYYMVRNYFYVAEKYAKDFPDEFRFKRKQLFVTLKNNLLFSGRFFKVFHSIVKGYLHYKQNRFS